VDYERIRELLKAVQERVFVRGEYMASMLERCLGEMSARDAALVVNAWYQTEYKGRPCFTTMLAEAARDCSYETVALCMRYGGAPYAVGPWFQVAADWWNAGHSAFEFAVWRRFHDDARTRLCVEGPFIAALMNEKAIRINNSTTDYGGDVNAVLVRLPLPGREEEGDTALTLAVRLNQPYCVEWLLGATTTTTWFNPRYREVGARGPQHHQQLGRGADANVVNGAGKLPLEVALASMPAPYAAALLLPLGHEDFNPDDDDATKDNDDMHNDNDNMHDDDDDDDEMREANDNVDTDDDDADDNDDDTDPMELAKWGRIIARVYERTSRPLPPGVYAQWARAYPVAYERLREIVRFEFGEEFPSLFLIEGAVCCTQTLYIHRDE
jgi:hypothetical protein